MPSSILQHTPATPPAEKSTPSTIKVPQSNKPARKTIINGQHKLLIAIDKDGHEKMFHVEDFVGLCPAWPIIKLAISPSGNTKDDTMNHFVKCCASLFTKILYVDDSAAIAPIETIDDKEDSYITNKVNLPTNLTKLGKWIMISRGSWMFSKKEKGKNDVYAHFCLKSQVMVEEIINQVSF